MGYAERVQYRRPSRVRRTVNRLVAWLAGAGLTPANTVRLEVPGRVSGRRRAFALTTASWRGEQYLVSLAGESEWVRNLRAAPTSAVIRHGRRRSVRVEEVPVDARGPVLRAYLAKRALTKSPAAAARDYFGVGRQPLSPDLQRIAGHYPVFRIVSEPEGDGAHPADGD
ncbi:MAG: nitroreductase family deazaflavin-dependent oxidoreductase [Candidatus Dormibacteraeota bacterium]|nr:nitroreductase family deazaflavin-dependent oxidoreductase [Candidatus Dormibacteraeota bacterium]